MPAKEDMIGLEEEEEQVPPVPVHPAWIAFIVIGIVLTIVVIGIVTYIRKHKEAIMNIPTVVRFRRPDARTLDNDDTINVGDDDNNNRGDDDDKGPSSSGTELRDAGALGDNRFKKMVESLGEGIGEYKDRFKANFNKDDSMAAPLEEDVQDEISYQSTLSCSSQNPRSFSPAVIPISQDPTFDQPIHPPRTILKIFQEYPEYSNDAICPARPKDPLMSQRDAIYTLPESQHDRQFPGPSSNIQLPGPFTSTSIAHSLTSFAHGLDPIGVKKFGSNGLLLSPYLTPACSESEAENTDDDTPFSDALNHNDQQKLIV